MYFVPVHVYNCRCKRKCHLLLYVHAHVHFHVDVDVYSMCMYMNIHSTYPSTMYKFTFLLIGKYVHAGEHERVNVHS
jgi:hypothetical protein